MNLAPIHPAVAGLSRLSPTSTSGGAQELREAWPPMKAMIRGREATGIHNTVPDGRYKLSVFKLAEFGKLSKWKDETT